MPRIAVHRLGQTKDVFIKRLVYSNSVEGAILDSHRQIKAGSLKIVDGVWPKAAVKALMTDK